MLSYKESLKLEKVRLLDSFENRKKYYDVVLGIIHDNN